MIRRGLQIPSFTYPETRPAELPLFLLRVRVPAAREVSEEAPRAVDVSLLFEKPPHYRFELPAYSGRRDASRRAFQERRSQRYFHSSDAARQRRLRQP